MPESRLKIYYGRFQQDVALTASLLPLLDAAELARYHSIPNSLMRERFAQMHGRLRRLLAVRLNQNPAEILIRLTPYGKPYLPDFPEWRFNLSHSGDDFAVALATDCRLGLDLEQIKPRASFAPLVRKCFAETEAAYWRNMPKAEQTSAFYRIWTQKEAFVKAIGRGLALGLSHCVTDPANPRRFLAVPENCGHAADWQVTRWEIPGHGVEASLTMAAVADRLFTAVDLEDLP